MDAQKSLTEDWWLWGLLLLALVLAWGYYFLGMPQQQKDTGPVWLFSGVQKSDIDAVRLYRNGKQVVELQRQDNQFRLVSPGGVRPDTDAVNRWVETLLNPRLKSRFEARANEDYGIGEGGDRVEVVQGDDTHTLYVGKKNPLGSGSYLRYGSGEGTPMFVLQSGQKEQLWTTLKKLRETELFSGLPTDVQKLTLGSESETIVYERSGDSWVQTAPDSSVLSGTDAENINDDLSSITLVQASDFFDTAPPDSFSPVRGFVRLKFADGTSKTLEFGGSRNGKRLATMKGWPVVAIDEDPVKLFQDLPKTPSDWPAPVTPDQPEGQRPGTPSSMPQNLPEQFQPPQRP